MTNLRISDFRRRLRDHRTRLPQQRGRGDVVVDGPRADLDRVALLADARKIGYPRDADQQSGLAQTQLHQRHETVAARDELRLAIRRAELRQRVVERGGAAVFECRRYHDRPPWMIRHSFSGRSIMSTCLTPNSLSASTTAATTLGVEPSVPASPTPFAPSGFTGVGVTVASGSKRGKSMPRGIA